MLLQHIWFIICVAFRDALVVTRLQRVVILMTVALLSAQSSPLTYGQGRSQAIFTFLDHSP